MFDEIAGAYGSRFLLAAGGVGIALLCLLGLLWLMRNRRGPSPFVRGGRNRQPRLQVLDAAAVDTRRRLVLVRRDDVEHLIMIGGPTDIVIESGIVDPSKVAAAAPSFEASVAERPVDAAPRIQPVPAALPRAEEQRPAPSRPAATARPAEAPEEIYAPHAAASLASAPVAPVEPAVRAVPPAVATPPRPAVAPDGAMGVRSEPGLDNVTPQRAHPAPAPRPPAQSIPTVAAGTPVGTEDAAVRPASPLPIASFSENANPIRPVQSEPRELGGDFQSVLEEEMSNNLRAERILPSAPAAQRPTPPVPGERREPELDSPAGDNALQTEVARIFGEMSVNRDK